jgi:hypothetical protein
MSRATVDVDALVRFADELPVGVWVARAPSGEFVYANRTFAEIMGMAARDDVAVGEYAAPYGIHARDGALYPEEQMPFVRALRARETVVVDDIVIHRHDGRKVNIRAQAKPLLDEAGAITHVVIAFIDITREVEAEKQKREVDARLARAQKLESIGQLAGGIAHDFNNLLASVQVIASSLKRSERDPQRVEDLGRIEEVTQRAVALTRALLGFAGRARPSSRSVSLDRVVQDVGELARRTFDRRISIRMELGAGRVVTGDQSALEQVVMNLAVNARDAMPEGGELALRTFEQDGRVVLEVADTGPGIDPAIRDRVFEPFFTTKPAGEMRGLGLATAYGIVTSHGGTITIGDHPPHGAVVRVELPAADAEPAQAAAPKASRDARSGSETILVVDDEPLVLRASVRSLAALGYRVLEARDGAEALEVFREHRGLIDAVILDMMMPRMDGRETYLALREIDPGVRVLLTTGLANDHAQRVIELGARHVLAKPYDIARLTEALARVLAG